MKKKFFSLLIALSMLLTLLPANVLANAPGGIRYNGLGGIYIDINSAPFTTYAPLSASSYGAAGCTWFVSARVNQLTGKSVNIHSAENWKNLYSSYGFSYGTTPKAPAIICCTGGSYSHVAILEKIDGSTAYISEGGYQSAGAYYGCCNIRSENVNSIASTYAKSEWGGHTSVTYVYLDGASGGSTQTHTHSWSYANDSAHPHREYRTCSCGAKEYTGATKLVASCSSCYPIGNASLRRSFERTKKTAEFYRNNVSNANSYTLTLYIGGSVYNTYNMSSTTMSVSGLPSGTYYATLTAKNTNTGQSRSANCTSFTIVDTYEVRYNANGGSGAPSSQTKIQNETLTLTNAVPTRAHYIFKGWASSKTATEPQYSAGGTYTKNTPITLYAVWEPETYTITFDTNSGKGDAPEATITYGNVMKMPNSVTKYGYYLKGWSKSKTATTADYRIGLDYALDENMTLYAVWGQSAWSGDVAEEFAGGDGTEENPYLISDASELAHLADIVNNQTEKPEYKYYALTDNITLGGNEWAPIGKFDYEYQYFCGELDGAGFTISDLYISGSDTGNIGLIGVAKDSEIKNLTVVGDISSVTSEDAVNIGAFVANAENTKITGCTAMYVNMSNIKASSSEYSNIGCIAGKISGGGISGTQAKDCYISPSQGNFTLGIIAGYAAADITDCSVTSSESLFGAGASAGGLIMGGLCGSLTKTAENCVVEAGLLSNNISSSDTQEIGGLIGELSGVADVCAVKFTAENAKTIDGASYASSIYAASSGDINAGGLVGVSQSGAKVKDCMYDGKSVSGTADGNSYTGGLIGSAKAYAAPTITVSGGQSLSRSVLPARDGYTATWYTDSASKNEYDFSQIVTSDMTLYAKWTKDEDTEIWDGTSSEPAYNADTKTYTVTNGQELAWISDVANGVITEGVNFPENITFEGYTVELAKDIYLNDISDVDNWETTAPANSWKPIGGYNGFWGTFNGNNHTIYGMYFSDSNKSNIGLLGYLCKSKVSNITVDKGYIKGQNSVGGITGGTNGGVTVSNCANRGVKIVGNNDIGGISGRVVDVISYCYNNADIESAGEFYVGGIVGEMYLFGDEIISCCYNTGNIKAETAAFVGGIAGTAVGTIKDCYNIGNVFANSSAGGIGGWCDDIIITRCYNKGKITSNGTTGGIGGIVDISSTISYCYNIGTVSGNADYTANIAGRVSADFGSNNTESDKTYVKYCYANGTPLYNTWGSSEYFQFTSVAYKSSSAMKSLSNLSGFSTTDWAVNSNYNSGYPYLKSLEETYKTYIVTAIDDPENAAAVSHSFAHVGGVLFSGAGKAASSGGIIGNGSGASGASSDAINLLTVSDKISSLSSGSSYTANSGDIVGVNADEAFKFSGVYSYSETELDAVNSANSANAAKNTISETRPANQLTRTAFLKPVFGPDAYQSLDYLGEHPDAVWVIREGELPELYHTMLRDITLSDVENGTISVDKTQAVDGEIVTVTAIPEENYVLNKIYVNGVEIVGSTFEVDGDSDVYATFSEETPEYKVSVAASENAEVSLVNADGASEISLMSASDTLTAADGDEIQVSATADEEYTVDAVYVNGEEMSSDSFIITADSNITMDVTSVSTDIKATTGSATDIYGSYATLSGIVEDGENVTRYIRYWKTSNPDEVYTSETLDGGGEYSVTIGDLIDGTEYSYQMCDTGDVKTFTTMAEGVYSGEDDDSGNTPEPEETDMPTEPTPEPTPVPEPCFTVDMRDTYADVENTGAEQAVAVIIAEYNADGALVNVSTEDVLFAEDEIKRFDVPSNGKIFIWNSLSGMVPMTK